MGANVLVVGATSGIARALATQLAAQGKPLVLAARDSDETERIAADLRVRHGISIWTRVFDAVDFSSHREFLQSCLALGPLEGVFLCHGYMPEQAQAEADFAVAAKTFDINFASYVSLLSELSPHFRARGEGYICALSSVAGDRGRQSNYVYGAAKAALSTYLAGLRNQLHACGVVVTTVKPGFVDTAMTWGILSPDSPLVASPQRIARDAIRAVTARRNVVYTPWFWRWIMLIIRSIPEPIFKRLRL